MPLSPNAFHQRVSWLLKSINQKGSGCPLGAAHGLLGTSRNEPMRRTCPKQSMSQELPHVVLVIDLAGTMVHGKVQTSPSL